MRVFSILIIMVLSLSFSLRGGEYEEEQLTAGTVLSDYLWNCRVDYDRDTPYREDSSVIKLKFGLSYNPVDYSMYVMISSPDNQSLFYSMGQLQDAGKQFMCVVNFVGGKNLGIPLTINYPLSEELRKGLGDVVGDFAVSDFYYCSEFPEACDLPWSPYQKTKYFNSRIQKYDIRSLNIMVSDDGESFASYITISGLNALPKDVMTAILNSLARKVGTTNFCNFTWD